jgi:hypothetical protein
MAYRDQMKWDRAIADLDEAVRLNTRYEHTLYERAVLRFAIGRGGAADDPRTDPDIQGWRGDLSMYAALPGYSLPEPSTAML